MSELPPYFAGPPFHGGFHEPRPYLEESYEPYGPYAHPHPSMVLRIPRTVSAMPAFGPYTDSPYMGELGPRMPLRSSSAIPPYPYSDLSFHDVPRGPARSASSIPSFRESRPKHHKVAPEIELRVQMSSSDEQRLKEALRRLSGVTGVVTDRRNDKVTVSGKVDPQVVLKSAQKIKRKADFWTKDIYSRAFIEFIQSKTGRAEPEPDVTSSYHQHAPSDEGECHHAYEESENLSSYEEYPGYPEAEEQETIQRPAPFEENRGYYNYDPYPSSSQSYGTVDDRPRYETTPYFESSPFPERVPYYGDDSSSSYRPSQGYGPSGVSNPGYMKRVMRDY